MLTSIENRIKSFYEHNGYKYAPPYPCVAANCPEVSRDPKGDCWTERWPGVYVCCECAANPSFYPVDATKFPKLMPEPEHKPGPIERAMRWWRKA